MTDNEYLERISKVQENIASACKRAGRDASEVTLVGVSKVFPVECAQAAFRAGLRNFGENRVQELVPKIEAMSALDMKPNWHLIGTLQKNKVKYIIGKTYLIHSVDTVELATEISKRSANAGIISDILLEANISGELSKHGFSQDELKGAIEAVANLSGVRLRGLMTMAPIQSVKGEARPVFAQAKKVFDELKSTTNSPADWNILSMGMSQDYDIAIEEGSTIVRVGTAIFGDRSKLLNP